MSRRKSTIGYDPLQAISLEAAPRPVPVAPRSRPPKASRAANSRATIAQAKSPADQTPKKEPPVMAAGPVRAPVPAPLPARPPLEVQATAIVRSYFGWSAAAGLVPVPWLDFAAVVAVLSKMVEDLAHLYGKPVDRNSTKPAIIGLLTTTGGFLLAGPAAGLLRVVPIIGPLAGMLTQPAMATASCWITGRVFIRHFEQGGTIDDFDPATAVVRYKAEFNLAKGAA